MMRVAYNPRVKKIAAPSLQKKLGCDENVAFYFPPERWTLWEGTDLIIKELDDQAVENFVRYLELVEKNRPSPAPDSFNYCSVQI